MNPRILVLKNLFVPVGSALLVIAFPNEAKENTGKA
jgi:hypothetical protein